MKNILLTLALITGLVSFVPSLATNVYAADPLNKACDQLSAAQRERSAACSSNPSDNPLTGPNGLLNKIANIVALVAGVAAVIVIIVLGIAMITSAGDTQRVAQSRNGILAAVAGLVVIVLAKSLITFVINRL